MRKLLLLVSLVLLSSCYQTGYQPHYIISQEDSEQVPPAIQGEHSF